jgi:hypothetical protein
MTEPGDVRQEQTSLGRALRRIAQGSRLTSLDVPIIEEAADKIDALASQPAPPGREVATATSSKRLRGMLADAWWNGAMYAGERSCHAMKQACDVVLQRTEADGSPVKEERDPIASAVRAELQPLEDALIDAGHKLAKQAPPDTCDDLCMLPVPEGER